MRKYCHFVNLLATKLDISTYKLLFLVPFIANITVGGFNLQLLGFVPEIIDIITASIIYFSAFSLLFKSLISKLVIRRSRDDDEDHYVPPDLPPIQVTEKPQSESAQGGGEQ